jgi:hypothetical protein
MRHVWGRICAYRFWWRKLKEGDDLEAIDTDGRVILKWIFKKWGGASCTGLFWFRIVRGAVVFKAEIQLCSLE